MAAVKSGPEAAPAPSSVLRKVIGVFGFAKLYNFILWVLFAGGFFGFALSRTPYLNFYGYFCGPGSSSSLSAAPGECWYYLRGDHETIGIILHLVTIIPASILATFQFTPIIRRRFVLFHRINGYIVLLLSFLSTAGAIMIARHAFGGGLETQMAIGVMGILFLGSLVMSYINIKRLQIEEHRAWMLRAWFYAASIITLRLVMFFAAMIISKQYGYYSARPCGQIDSMFEGNRSATMASYPACASYYSGENTDQWAIVRADMFGDSAAEAATALGVSFGPAAWLCLALHGIGIEIYLKLTPAENQRLRIISYQRQLAAGMRNPGSAGLTVDRFGDSEKWMPPPESVSSD